jgi:hypothetical protein
VRQKSLILPIVLYAFVTWFLTLREEPQLRVFMDSVLRKCFEPDGEEVTDGCS